MKGNIENNQSNDDINIVQSAYGSIQRNSSEFAVLHQASQVLMTQSKDTCLQYSKGLQIYFHCRPNDSEKVSLLTRYSMMLTEMMVFRFYCYKHWTNILQKYHYSSSELSIQERSLCKATFNRFSLENIQSHEKLLVACWKYLLPSSDIFDESEINLEDQAKIVLEMIGVVIPHGQFQDFICGQLYIELHLLSIAGSAAYNDPALSSMKNEKVRNKRESPAYYQTMEDIKKTVVHSITLDSRKKTPSNTLKIRENVVENVNSLLHNQRIEQVSHYIDYLNNKAAKKREILQSLIATWRALKRYDKKKPRTGIEELSALFPPREHMSESAKRFDDVLNSENEIMTLDEIESRTRSVQRALISEASSAFHTTDVQLESRVTMLRNALSDGSISDPGDVLMTLIREVDALEASILLANKDAINFSSKIMVKLSTIRTS